MAMMWASEASSAQPWLLRCLPTIVVPVLLLGSNFHHSTAGNALYVVFAMSAAVIYPAVARWPRTVAFVEAALSIPIVGLTPWGPAEAVRYLGAIAAAEAAARSGTARRAFAAMTPWFFASAMHPVIAGFHHSPDRIAVDAAVAVGIPLLVGQYLLRRRELAAARRAQAVEAEKKRTEADIHARQLMRSTLARELHDMVAHHVTAIALHSGVARHVLTDTSVELRHVLNDVHDTASQALIDIRRLHTALQAPRFDDAVAVDPGSLGTGIAEAIERTRAAGYIVNSELATMPELDAVGRLTLLRVTQEALSNVMKHANNSAPVTLSITTSDHAVRLEVTNTPSPNGHVAGIRTTYGVVGIRERIDIVGGTLDVGLRDGQWLLSAQIPAKASRASARTIE